MNLTPPQAPEYYDEIQSHIAMQGGPGGDGGKGKGGAAGGVQISDFWFDVGGWVILGAVVVGALLLAKGSAPKPTAS